MSSVHTKAFACQSCKKLISYDRSQAGSEAVCPRCGLKQRVPAEGEQPPPLPEATRRKKRLPCLLVGCGGCLSALIALAVLLALGVFVALPLRVPPSCQRLVRPLVSRGYLQGTAPETATFAGSDVAVSVTGIARTCPAIYQASLKRLSPTETPVFRVTVQICNNGKGTVSYRTWRAVEDASDAQRAAVLTDDSGIRLGLVSFGANSWPEGAVRRVELAPGDTATDILLFECGDSQGGWTIRLPGENVGLSSELRFRIPRELVR